MPFRHRVVAAIAAAGAITTAGLAAAPGAEASSMGSSAFINHFTHIRTVVSTIPANGDLNPYGIFVIRHSTGRLHKGNILVSNFNNKSNLQGTGTTIVQITPGGHRTLFAHINASTLPGRCPGGVGLTTALEVLPGGWVVVGSTPSKNGQAATAKAGCLIVLNHNGRVVETFSGGGINGPWDAAMVCYGRVADLFVDNVLNGTVKANGKVVNGGTVLRLTLLLSSHHAPRLVSTTRIGSGFAEQTNATAFILGPTGLGLGRHDTLYVADTQNSTITAIHHALVRPGSAGTGATVTSGGMLNMPLGLAIAPNGDILTVNGGDGRLVETTPAGMQIAHRYLDRTPPAPIGAGALFGLAVAPHGSGVYYVDDDTNTLRLLH
jgi:sugar lactone lactonase YvrE